MPLTDYNKTYAYKMRNREYLDAYLAACWQEKDAAFYVGRRRAAQARANGFTWLAAQTGLGRENLYRALSAEGNPSFRTIRRVLHALDTDERIIAHTAEALEPERRPAKRRAVAAS